MARNGAGAREVRGHTYRFAAADRLIGRIASIQHGRVSREQLLQRGVGPDLIDRRLRSGRLLRERPGVYAVPAAPDGSRGRCAVALLDAGTGSLVSCLSAAAEWRMEQRSPRVVDITNPRRLRSRKGIRLHRRLIHPEEIRRLDGLPITSPAQTIFDLAALLGTDSLAKIANQGFVEGVLTIEALRLARTRNAGRKGATGFRRLLDRLDPEGRRVRSPLEVRVGEFLRERSFPPWEQNVRIEVSGERVEPDFLWREQRVILEADGRGPHLAPLTFNSDRRKDRRARVAGWQPVRVTSADLDRPDELERDLRALLGA